MRVIILKRDQIPGWQNLRSQLWPHLAPEEHRREIIDILSDAEFNAVFAAVGRDKKLHGFVEASIRMSAEGCRTNPVGYLEGWFVEPRHRGKGVGKALLKRAEAWALSRGCREMASDTEVENEASLAAHTALGYEQVSRLIHFRKPLKES
jgi:aminoglycoside 6'-N-acetyltransferase I